MEQSEGTRRYSFVLDLLLGQKFTASCTTEVSLRSDGETVMEISEEPGRSEHEIQLNSLYVYDLPDYLNITFSRKGELQRKLQAPLYTGFSIDLKQFQSYQDYLQQRLSAKKRSQFRGIERRFEHCIEPNYKVYGGTDLSEQECHELMLRLEHMLKERFQQKGESNYELPLMKYYRKVFYPLMLQNKGCFYVIYDGTRAISISMNLILGNTLMLFNSSYDVCYAPFELGHINMLRHLEWAFNQGLERLDLGRGDYLHKRRWVNNRYTYLEIVTGFQGSYIRAVLACFKMGWLHLRYRIIQLLKLIGLHKVYGFLRKNLYSLRHRNNSTTATEVEQAELIRAEGIDRKSLLIVDLSADAHTRELSAYLSILYRHRLSKKELKTYRLRNKPEVLFVEKEGELFKVVTTDNTAKR